MTAGEDVLPIVVVDGKIRFTGTWPFRADLASCVGVQVPVVGADLLAPGENPCCTLTEQASTGCCTPQESITGCCTPTDRATTGCCAPAEQARQGAGGCC